MTRRYAQRVCSGVAAALVVATLTRWHATAQARPKADVMLLLDADGVHPGGAMRLAVRVALADGVHVQSNAPRDPLLIATALTIMAPDGVSVDEIVYPPSADF